MDNSSGAAGEEFTAQFLQKKGYEILQRNYHSRYGEIDIIARGAGYLAFVEVKTREKGSIVEPLEAVTVSKQRKIIRTAQCYLQTGPQNLQPRFDVAAVTAVKSIPKEILYLKNAFSGIGFV